MPSRPAFTLEQAHTLLRALGAAGAPPAALQLPGPCLQYELDARGRLLTKSIRSRFDLVLPDLLVVYSHPQLPAGWAARAPVRGSAEALQLERVIAPLAPGLTVAVEIIKRGRTFTYPPRLSWGDVAAVLGLRRPGSDVSGWPLEGDAFRPSPLEASNG